MVKAKSDNKPMSILETHSTVKYQALLMIRDQLNGLDTHCLNPPFSMLSDALASPSRLPCAEEHMIDKNLRYSVPCICG